MVWVIQNQTLASRLWSAFGGFISDSVAMRSLGKIQLWKVIVASTILGICASFPVYMRIPEQCVLCRAECDEYHLFGVTFFGGFRDNGEFTRWYVTHRPPHAHVWHCSHPGCLADHNFFGLPLSLYMMRGHPILFLTPGEELRFVKRADVSTLSEFFADAASTNLGAQLRAQDTARKRMSDSIN